MLIGLLAICAPQQTTAATLLTATSTFSSHFVPSLPVLMTQASSVTPAYLALPTDERFQLGVRAEKTADGTDGFWMRMAANQLMVPWVGVEVDWKTYSDPDKQHDFGSIEWKTLDSAINAAGNQGLRVMLTIFDAPDWAREPGVELLHHGPPADVNNYAYFVATLLERYPGKTQAVEVWKDINLDREWTSISGLNAANYVNLLAATRQVVKAIDPNVIIISGALIPTGVDDGRMAYDDFHYLNQLIQAGLLNVADCIGVSQYGYNFSPDALWNQIPNDPTAMFRGPFDNPYHTWSFASTLQGYTSRIEAAGGRQKLCLTRFGWPSADGLGGYPIGFEFAKDNTLAEQRDFTISALNDMVRWNDVWLAFLPNLNSAATSASTFEYGGEAVYSMLNPDMTLRPVFNAARDWNQAYEQGQGG